MKLRYWKYVSAGHYTAETEEFYYLQKNREIDRMWQVSCRPKGSDDNTSNMEELKRDGWYLLLTSDTMREGRRMVDRHVGLSQEGNTYTIQKVGPTMHEVWILRGDAELMRVDVRRLYRDIVCTRWPKAMRELLCVARDEAIDLGLIS